MSDFIPKPGAIKIGGLSRAAQKLQSAREKAAAANDKGIGTKPAGGAFAAPRVKGSKGHVKTSFQRKAV
jgi:hypothetical protein